MCFNIIQHYLFVYHVIFVIFLYIYFNVTAINLIYKNTNDAITFYICYFSFINPLKTKRRLLYLRTQFVLHSKHFHLGYKNQSVYAVSGTSRCLFSDKYKTHKYSVGRVYNCWMLKCWCITWPVGFKRSRILDCICKTKATVKDLLYDGLCNFTIIMKHCLELALANIFIETACLCSHLCLGGMCWILG